jgi:hypothetical protein
MDNDTRKFIRKLRREGWTVRHTSKHWLARSPDLDGYISIPDTSSDQRNIRNLRAAYRRYLRSKQQ